jgi:hypothetical protein
MHVGMMMRVVADRYLDGFLSFSCQTTGAEDAFFPDVFFSSALAFQMYFFSRGGNKQGGI